MELAERDGARSRDRQTMEFHLCRLVACGLFFFNLRTDPDSGSRPTKSGPTAEAG